MNRRLVISTPGQISVYTNQRMGGTNWSPFSVGLPRVAVFDMAVKNNHRILRIATQGRGLREIAL